MPINKERVMKLVERLRDPESRQAKYKLRNGPRGKGMCCLGHACEVFRLETKLGEWKKEYDEGAFHLPDGEWSTGTLPKGVQDWYGFDTKDPMLTVGGMTRAATDWNDNWGKTLPEIADGFEALCAE